MTAVEIRTVRECAGRDPARVPTGLDWFDAALGGGLVPRTVVMLSGAPGAGKSTLLGQVAAAVPGSCYVTAEETAEAVGARMARTGHGDADTGLASADGLGLGALLGACAGRAPRLVVLDSAQTLRVDGIGGGPGSARQVVAVAGGAVEFARRTGACVVLVCHETKGGRFAGPRTLEHAVDVHLILDRDRVLGAVKNRYGATDVRERLTMTQRGLVGRRAPAGRRPRRGFGRALAWGTAAALVLLAWASTWGG
jgi:DNA repair protein RadA/Sms